MRDVTERKRAETALRDMHEVHRRIDRCQQRTGGAKPRNRGREPLEERIRRQHEPRIANAVTPIVGFTELLAEELEGPLNEKQKRFLSHIHRDSLHLLELINDISNEPYQSGAARPASGSFRHEGGHRRGDGDHPPTGPGNSLHLEGPFVPDIALRADRVRYKEVLYNLLSNAVKFTPEGGRIRVEGSLRDKAVEISVIDTGVGIPALEQAPSSTNSIRSGPPCAVLRRAQGSAWRSLSSWSKRMAGASGCRAKWAKEAASASPCPSKSRRAATCEANPHRRRSSLSRQLVRTVLEHFGTAGPKRPMASKPSRRPARLIRTSSCSICTCPALGWIRARWCELRRDERTCHDAHQSRLLPAPCMVTANEP